MPIQNSSYPPPLKLIIEFLRGKNEKFLDWLEMLRKLFLEPIGFFLDAIASLPIGL